MDDRMDQRRCPSLQLPTAQLGPWQQVFFMFKIEPDQVKVS